MRAGAWLQWALTALDRPVSDVPAGPVPPDLAERSEFHGISPLVHLALGALTQVPPSVAATLRSSYHHAVQRHLATLDDLQVVAEALGGLGHPWLVFKGPVLSGAVYPRPDWRSYADLDVAVPAAHLRQAVRLLVAAGCRLPEQDWGALVRRRAGEVHLRLPSGSELDLHWHLINDGTVRRRFGIQMADVFAAARPVKLGGRTYLTMSASHTMVHLALHGCLAGANRLVWTKDLEQVIRRDEVDWDEVHSVTASWGAVPAVAAQLERCRRIVGMELSLPARAIAQAGRQWAGLTALADRAGPPARSTGQPSIARLVWRATGASTGASVLGAGRKAGVHLLNRTRSPVPRGGARGGHDGRRTYFDLVAAEDPQGDGRKTVGLRSAVADRTSACPSKGRETGEPTPWP